MAAYSKVNFRDVDDSAVEFGLAPNMEARFARTALGLEQNGISLQRLAPGFRQPFGHRHEAQEEIYVVLEGSGRAAIEGEVVDLAPLDAVRVAPAVTRQFEGGPDGMRVLVFGPHRQGDGEIVKDWWTD